MSNITFECDTTTDGLLKTNIIDLHISDFSVFLIENSYRVFQTKETYCDDKKKEDALELRILLKINFRKDNNIIDVYYRSLDPVVLMYNVMLLYPKTGDTDYYSIAKKKYHTLKAFNWQHLITLYKKILCSSPYSIESDLCLKFQFNSIIVSEQMDGTLSTDFKYLLNNEMLSDLTIVSAEHVKYKVHKAVLASRSPVLKAHFEHNTTECLTNIIECAFESEVLREVLTFIYSDKAPRVNEIPDKLLVAADYYQLSGLKSLCEEALHNKLTVENATNTLLLADMHSAENLKRFTMEFIKDQAGLIIKTEGWAQFNCIKLIKMIFEQLTNEDLMVNEIQYHDVHQKI